MLKNNIKLSYISLILSVLNFVLFHYAFFNYVVSNVDYKSFSGVLLIVSLAVIMLIANAFTFFLILFLFRFFGKILIGISFLISAIAVYFVNTYSIIVDESMIGNVLNTNYEESSAFFSFKMILYFILLAILPVFFIFRVKIVYPTVKRFFAKIGISLLLMLLIVAINAKNTLWIDNHSKQLGGLAMPWSYAVNTSLYYIHKAQKDRKEIRLPDATITNQEKSVVVLVIGESARRQNFSLYGYPKNTNPLLSKTENLFHFKANSCATYTTAGVKCILEHTNSDDLYEILPNYLHRNNVEVIWRTTNSGEPPLHIPKIQDGETLRQTCLSPECQYDEVLVSSLKEEILSSTKPKVLVVLHMGTSHGPTYSKKYPSNFEVFKPVCNSVDLSKCTSEELINAYDNTILYTDYILHKVIENLKQLTDYKSSMIFVSDHGESLGEKNMYMHGAPMSFAPKEQYEIPFIVWVSEKTQRLKKNNMLSQHHIFHSVLHFLSVQSRIYNEEMNIFETKLND